MREEIRNTWRQAQEDFETARVTIGVGRFYASVFFSQQAAEKALNTHYMTVRNELPMTHNLVALCRDLQAPERINAAARQLNPDYLTTRYTDAANGVPAEMYDQQSAQMHLDLAKEVVEWVQSKLGGI